MHSRPAAPAAILAHLMSAPLSPKKALAQEARVRDSLRADNLFSIMDNQSRNDSRTGLRKRS